MVNWFKDLWDMIDSFWDCVEVVIFTKQLLLRKNDALPASKYVTYYLSINTKTLDVILVIQESWIKTSILIFKNLELSYQRLYAT